MNIHTYICMCLSVCIYIYVYTYDFCGWAEKEGWRLKQKKKYRSKGLGVRPVDPALMFQNTLFALWYPNIKPPTLQKGRFYKALM